MMKTRPLALALAVLWASGCAAAQASEPPSTPPSGGPELFSGLCVPLNATDMLAPEASFRFGGWNSNWSQQKVMELMKDGTPVKAASCGTVTTAGADNGGYGNLVCIEHEGGKTSCYAHLSTVNARQGQNVKAGQVIGKVGGRSLEGSHARRDGSHA